MTAPFLTASPDAVFITNPMSERYLTQSLRRLPEGKAITRILDTAILAVDPRRAVAKFLSCEGDTIFVDQRAYANPQRVFLISAGKASIPMAEAGVEILGNRLTSGIVITKVGHAGSATRVGPLPLFEAGHPLPNRIGTDAASRIMDLLSNTSPDDLILFLISGGGSALLTLPVVPLDDLRNLTDQLLACGATINEINTLRKHLDRVKGGGLARSAAPAHAAALILSDVVGNPLDIIASGPTVPDPSTFSDAEEILKKYAMWETVPPSIRAHLSAGAAGMIPENPKPGDPIFARVQNVLVGSNELAAEAARQKAEQEGFAAEVMTTTMEGEAKERALWLLKASEGRTRPLCLIAGGETTVTLGQSMGNVGKGGRNQEMALAAVRAAALTKDVVFVTLATDGGDGPTDAAGAVVTHDTLTRAAAAGLDPDDFLHRHDAYNFFDPLGDLLKPGPTQTNVNDLAFVFGLGH